MKKNYFLVALFAFAMTSVSAQFADDMESYSAGQELNTSPWTTWATGAGFAVASDAYASNGTLSAYVDGSGKDPVLDFGSKIFGRWEATFKALVPAGSTGYFNLQGIVPIGSGEWLFELPMESGVGTLSEFNHSGATFTYTEGEWFDVRITADISSGMTLATYELEVNGQTLVPAGSPLVQTQSGAAGTSFGGLNIYSAGTSNAFYMDEIELRDMDIVGISDFAEFKFQAYPNPVNNVMNLQANENISKVANYNVLGQEVYSAKINAMTSSVNMSSMASGAYFVKVNINGTEGTVKVIK